MDALLRALTALPDNEFRPEHDLRVGVAGAAVDLVEEELGRAFTDQLPRLPDGEERDG